MRSVYARPERLDAQLRIKASYYLMRKQLHLLYRPEAVPIYYLLEYPALFGLLFLMQLWDVQSSLSQDVAPDLPKNLVSEKLPIWLFLKSWSLLPG